MSVKDFDMFLLQILVKNFVLFHQPSLRLNKTEAMSPTINLKIHEGPTIMIPYLSKEEMEKYSKAQQNGYNHPPIEVEEAMLRGGIYNFNKGKSCLFTKPYEIKPNIRFRIEIIDGLIFPSTILGNSCVIEKDFKKSSKTETLLDGPLKIYEDKNKEFGTISLIIRMESIDSEDQLNEDVSKTHYTNNSFKTFGMSTLDYGISQEEKVLQEDGKALKISPNSKIKSDFGNKGHSRTSQPKFNHEARKNISQEKPTGWLRSTPLLKHKRDCTKTDPSSNRTSFLRLYKTYPDLEKHVNNEVERQLREKAKLIESELQKKYENVSKGSSNKGLARRHYNNRAKSSKGLQTECKIKSNKGLQTESNIITDKETFIGDSLIESPTKPNVLQIINDQSTNSSRSLNYSPTFTESGEESIGESIESNSSILKNSHIPSKSASMKDNNLIESSKLSSGNGNYLSESSTPHIQNIMKIEENLETEEISEEMNLSNSQTKSETLEKTKSEEIMSVKTDINNEAEENVPSLNCDLNSYHQKSVERQLHKQSSKTSSSIYPQSSEEKVQTSRQLETVPQRSSSEDMEKSIEDLSEKIANILKPKTESIPSIHTNSVSSFVPSNLSDAYSSLSDF